mmetsp:Transcript_14836/g.21058  ORF Transcript_14836/g.21058 Transcript_14836/m.21058 type:complete len:455 (-) Transcript_14836:10-1374(-)
MELSLSGRDVIRFNADQCNNLSFPIGCPVWYNFAANQGTTLKRGVVKSAALRSSQLVYEVTYSDDNENVITDVVEDKQIGFGATCPVEISSSQSDDDNVSLEGEIVLCTPSPTNSSKFVYSAMIFLDGSRIRYENGIEEERVKYRKLNNVDGDENNDNQTGQEEPTVVSKQFGPMAATPPPPPMTANHGAVPNSIRVGQADNSVDSSSRKRPRDKEESKVKAESMPHKKSKCPDEQPDLEIPVPLWLQKDRNSQRELFHHLLGRSSDGRLGCNMKRIRDETQCKIAVCWDEKPIVIKIFAKNSKMVSKTNLFPVLKRVRLIIQDLLLRFIGNDGSRGRLVYEIAKSCSGSHRPNKSTSNAVRDINPFHTDYSSESYISIVDIPNDFVREGKHHQLHMALVGSIRDVGCKMDIVADGFTHNSNLCEPYVLVYGATSKFQDVDRAVKMVEDKIRQS